MRQTDAIHAERETLRHVPAIFSHLKIQPELVPDRYQLALRDKSSPLRIAHLNAKLSPILLCGSRKSQNACRSQESNRSLNERVHHVG